MSNRHSKTESPVSPLSPQSYADFQRGHHKDRYTRSSFSSRVPVGAQWMAEHGTNPPRVVRATSHTHHSQSNRGRTGSSAHAPGSYFPPDPPQPLSEATVPRLDPNPRPRRERNAAPQASASQPKPARSFSHADRAYQPRPDLPAALAPPRRPSKSHAAPIPARVPPRRPVPAPAPAAPPRQSRSQSAAVQPSRGQSQRSQRDPAFPAGTDITDWARYVVCSSCGFARVPVPKISHLATCTECGAITFTSQAANDGKEERKMRDSHRKLQYEVETGTRERKARSSKPPAVKLPLGLDGESSSRRERSGTAASRGSLKSIFRTASNKFSGDKK